MSVVDGRPPSRTAPRQSVPSKDETVSSIVVLTPSWTDGTTESAGFSAGQTVLLSSGRPSSVRSNVFFFFSFWEAQFLLDFPQVKPFTCHQSSLL